MGAFFIRRRLDDSGAVVATPLATTVDQKDHMYRAVLQSYMTELLESGQNIEFFLEGTRSRFGKTLTPKNGLISIVVDCCQRGKLLIT